jgi:hypothetical protein
MKPAECLGIAIFRRDTQIVGRNKGGIEMSGQAQRSNRYIDNYLHELETKRLDEEWAKRSRERQAEEQAKSIRVNLPDGRVIVFPSGTPLAQMQSEIAKLSPASPNSHQKSWFDQNLKPSRADPFAQYVVPARTLPAVSVGPDLTVVLIWLAVATCVIVSTRARWKPVATAVKHGIGQWIARGCLVLITVGAFVALLDDANFLKQLGSLVLILGFVYMLQSMLMGDKKEK